MMEVRGTPCGCIIRQNDDLTLAGYKVRCAYHMTFATEALAYTEYMSANAATVPVRKAFRMAMYGAETNPEKYLGQPDAVISFVNATGKRRIVCSNAGLNTQKRKLVSDALALLPSTGHEIVFGTTTIIGVV